MEATGDELPNLAGKHAYQKMSSDYNLHWRPFLSTGFVSQPNPWILATDAFFDEPIFSDATNGCR